MNTENISNKLINSQHDTYRDYLSLHRANLLLDTIKTPEQKIKGLTEIKKRITLASLQGIIDGYIVELEKQLTIESKSV